MLNLLKKIFSSSNEQPVKINTSILSDILYKSLENNEIISVWQYGDKGSNVGYITEISDEHITLKHYTFFGKCDGLVIIRIANIKTIDFNDDYTKVMECVIQYSAIFDEPSSFNLKLGYSNNWQYNALLQLVKAESQVASFEINGGDFFTGLVTKISESDFVLNCIGKNGENQGTAVYRIEDVTEIKINDLDNRRRLLLYNWRKASL